MHTAMNSAIFIEYHIPAVPMNNGIMSTAELSKTSVRIKDITAEVRPSLSAVKKAEPKIEKPASKNEKA